MIKIADPAAMIPESMKVSFIRSHYNELATVALLDQYKILPSFITSSLFSSS
jgi:hypothetical protein